MTSSPSPLSPPPRSPPNPPLPFSGPSSPFHPSIQSLQARLNSNLNSDSGHNPDHSSRPGTPLPKPQLQFPPRLQSLQSQSQSTETPTATTPASLSRTGSISSTSTLRFSSPEIPPLPAVPTRVDISESTTPVPGRPTVSVRDQFSASSIASTSSNSPINIVAPTSAPPTASALHALLPPRSPSPDTDGSSVYYTSWGSPYPLPITNTVDAASARARSIRSSLRGTRRFRPWPFPAPAPLSDEEIDSAEAGDEDDEVPPGLEFDLGHLIPQVVPDLQLSRVNSAGGRTSYFRRNSHRTQDSTSAQPTSFPSFLPPSFSISPIEYPHNLKSPSSTDYPSSAFLTPRSVSGGGSTVGVPSGFGAISPLRLPSVSGRPSLHRRDETATKLGAKPTRDHSGEKNTVSDMMDQRSSPNTTMPTSIMEPDVSAVLQDWGSARINIVQPAPESRDKLGSDDSISGTPADSVSTNGDKPSCLPLIQTDHISVIPTISIATSLGVPTPTTAVASSPLSPFLPGHSRGGESPDSLSARRPVSKKLGKRIFRILMPLVEPDAVSPVSDGEIQTRIADFKAMGYDTDRNVERTAGWAQVRERDDCLSWGDATATEKPVPIVNFSDGKAWNQMMEEVQRERLRALGACFAPAAPAVPAGGGVGSNPVSGPGSVTAEDARSLPGASGLGIGPFSPDLSTLHPNFGMGVNPGMVRAASAGFSPFMGNAGPTSGGGTPVLGSVGGDSRNITPTLGAARLGPTAGPGNHISNSISPTLHNSFAHTGAMPNSRRDSVANFGGFGPVPASAGLPGGPGSVAFEAAMNNRPPRVSSMPFPHGHTRFASLAPGVGMMPGRGMGPAHGFGGPESAGLGPTSHMPGHGRHSNMSVSFGPGFGMRMNSGPMNGINVVPGHNGMAHMNGMRAMNGVGPVNGMNSQGGMRAMRHSPRLQHLNLHNANSSPVLGPHPIPAGGGSPILGIHSPNLPSAGFASSPLGISTMVNMPKREQALEHMPEVDEDQLPEEGSVPDNAGVLDPVEPRMILPPPATSGSALDQETADVATEPVPNEGGLEPGPAGAVDDTYADGDDSKPVAEPVPDSQAESTLGVAGDGDGQVTSPYRDQPQDQDRDQLDHIGPDAVSDRDNDDAANGLENESPARAGHASDDELPDQTTASALAPEPAPHITSASASVSVPATAADNIPADLGGPVPDTSTVGHSLPKSVETDAPLPDSMSVTSTTTADPNLPRSDINSKRLSISFNAAALEFIPLDLPPQLSNVLHQTPRTSAATQAQVRNITPASTVGSVGKAKASPFSGFALEFKPQSVSGHVGQDSNRSMPSKSSHRRQPSDLSDVSMDVMLGRPIVGPAAGLMQFGSAPFGPQHGPMGGIAGWIAGLAPPHPSHPPRNSSIPMNVGAPVFQPVPIPVSVPIHRTGNSVTAPSIASSFTSPPVAVPAHSFIPGSLPAESRSFTFSFGSAGPRFGDIVVPSRESHAVAIEKPDVKERCMSERPDGWEPKDFSKRTRIGRRSLADIPPFVPASGRVPDDEDTKEDAETGRIDKADSRLKRTKFSNPSGIEDGDRDCQPLLNQWNNIDSPAAQVDSPLANDPIDETTNVVSDAQETEEVHTLEIGTEAEVAAEFIEDVVAQDQMISDQNISVALESNRDPEQIEDDSGSAGEWIDNPDGTILCRESGDEVGIAERPVSSTGPVTIPLAISPARDNVHMSDIDDGHNESDVSSIMQSPIAAHPSNRGSIDGPVHSVDEMARSSGVGSLASFRVGHSDRNSFPSGSSGPNAELDDLRAASLEEIDRVMRFMDEHSDLGIERDDRHDSHPTMETSKRGYDDHDGLSSSFGHSDSTPPMPIFSPPVRSAAPSPSPGRVAYAASRPAPAPYPLHHGDGFAIPIITPTSIVGTVNRLGGVRGEDDGADGNHKVVSEWDDDAMSAMDEQVGLRGSFFDAKVEDLVRRAVGTEVSIILDRIEKIGRRRRPKHKHLTDSGSDADTEPGLGRRRSGFQEDMSQLIERISAIHQRLENSDALRTESDTLNTELVKLRTENDLFSHRRNEAEQHRLQNERLLVEIAQLKAEKEASTRASADYEHQFNRLLSRTDKLSIERDESTAEVARLTGQVASYAETSATTKALLQSVRTGLADARQQAEADRSRWVAEVSRLTEQVEVMRVRLRVEGQELQREREEWEREGHRLREEKLRELERLRDEKAREISSLERRHADELDDLRIRSQRAADDASERMTQQHANEMAAFKKELDRTRAEHDLQTQKLHSETHLEITKAREDASRARAEHSLLAGKCVDLADRVASLASGTGGESERVKDLEVRLKETERRAEERIDRIDDARRLAEERVVEAERRSAEADGRTSEAERRTADSERRNAESESKLLDTERKLAAMERKLADAESQMKDVQARATEAITAAAHQAIESKRHHHSHSTASQVSTPSEPGSVVRALRETVDALQKQLVKKDAEIDDLTEKKNVSDKALTQALTCAPAELAFLRELLDVQRDEISQLIEQLNMSEDKMNLLMLRDAAIRIDASLRMATEGNHRMAVSNGQSPASVMAAMRGPATAGSVARLVGSVSRGTPARWMSAVFSPSVTSGLTESTAYTTPSSVQSNPHFPGTPASTSASAVGSLWRRVSASPAVRGMVGPGSASGTDATVAPRSASGAGKATMSTAVPSTDAPSTGLGIFGSVPFTWVTPEPATPIDPDAIEFPITVDFLSGDRSDRVDVIQEEPETGLDADADADADTAADEYPVEHIDPTAPIAPLTDSDHHDSRPAIKELSVNGINGRLGGVNAGPSVDWVQDSPIFDGVEIGVSKRDRVGGVMTLADELENI